MQIEIAQEGPEQLDEYARVSIDFVVTDVFDASAIEALSRGENAQTARLSAPYRKDYDACVGERPTDWPAHFDVAGWVFLAAYLHDRRVGGAAVVMRDPNVELLRHRSKTALLWDIRVAPETRHQGIGTRLLDAAQHVAREGGANRLLVETQHINVPACRFYQRHGFTLEAVAPHVYPELPQEVRLLWSKPIAMNSRPSG